jgi:subtilase family serine protease
MSLLSLALSPALCAQESEDARVPLDRQHSGGGHIITPQSSIERPEDLGVRAHTHSLIFIPPAPSDRADGIAGDLDHPDNTPVADYYAETPATLACIYGLVAKTTGCNPVTIPIAKVATGGSKAIAIVDAYDYPTALNDLKKYSAEFHLPPPTTTTFTVTWATTKPTTDPNCAGGNGWNCWSSEESLDIEMAHAMAPKAHIYLVEALSPSYADLFAAEKKAISLVKAAGGGEVSNSWGGGEGSGETAFDSSLVGAKVVIFASTGDREGTEYPSTSPNVVAVGGTTLNRSPANGDIEAETAWEDGGGGVSPVEAIPSYQHGIASIIGTHRGVPDVAAVANPRTGVWIYDSYETANLYGVPDWAIFGGTSVASPLWAGIVNSAGHFNASSNAELTEIYADAHLTADFRDVTYGFCGYYAGWFAVAGWDPCTGNGVPVGAGGK